jgi:hypothetical protein
LIRLYRGDPLPDPHLTPGTATAGVSLTSICENTYAASIPRVPDATARQVFARYHISYNDRASYELDHLIPLELGGDNSIRNLWPEEGPSPNSKDYLEIRLHNQVCKNKLSLSEAQRLISTNWAAEFLKGGGSHKLSTGPPKPPKQPKKPKKKHASPSPSPTH